MPQGIEGVTAGTTIMDSLFKQRSRIGAVGYPGKKNVRECDLGVEEAEMGSGSGMVEAARMACTARGEAAELVLYEFFGGRKESGMDGGDEDGQEGADGRGVVSKPGKAPESAVVCAPALGPGQEVGMALFEGEEGGRGALDVGVVWEEKGRVGLWRTLVL